MRRKLNIKLIAGLVLGMGLIAGVVYVVHGWQVTHAAHYLLTQADLAMSAKDDKKAEAFFAQYLTFVPNDLEAIHKYAQVLDRRINRDGVNPARRPDLVLRMEQVLHVKPEENAFRLRLVENLILLDRFADARTQLKRLLAHGEDKEKAEVWHMLARCQEADRDYQNAVKSLREAIGLDPTRLPSCSFLAELLQEHFNQPDDALAVMDEMVKQNPDSWQAFLMRSRFHRKRGGEALAEADLEKALKLAPTEVEVTYEAAFTAVLRSEKLAVKGEYPAANAVLDAAKTAYPKEVIVWCALADLAIMRNQWAEAEKLLADAAAEKEFAGRVELDLAKARLWSRHGTSADLAKLIQLSDTASKSAPGKDRVRLCRELADTWYRLGDWRRAEQFWRAVAVDAPKDLPTRLYLLELALQQNQIDAARRWHGEIRKAEGEGGPVASFGAAAILTKEAHGDPEKLKAARKLVDELRPDHESPRLALMSARICELEGRYQDAAADYSRALHQGDAQPRVLARLLELLLERREFAKAEAELTRFEQRLPLTRDLARLGAEVAVGMRDKDFAPAALRRAALAVTLPSADYREHLWLAKIYHAAGDSREAEARLREAVRLAPHTPDTWIALAELLAETNQREQAEKELARLRKELPASLQALTIARCYEAMWLPQKASKAYEDALAAHPNDVALLNFAADFFRRADREKEARALYVRLLDPKLAAPAEFTVKARRQLAVLLAEQGDTNARTQALALVDEIRGIRGETLADERIRLYIAGQSEAERGVSVQKFQASARRQILTADEKLLLARLLEKSGQLAQAKTQLAEVETQYPRVPHYLARYAEVLIQTEEFAAARRVIERLEMLEPGSRRVLALKKDLR